MKTVYKYLLNFPDGGEVLMPAGAQILRVELQNNTPCLWALVDSKAETWVRKFRFFGTGEPIPEDVVPSRYIGTIFFHFLVFHIFETT